MFYIFAGKLIFREAEIDFSEWVNMRRPWRGRRTGDGSGGLTPGGGAGVSGWGFQSDFTNEMGQSFRTERAGSQGHPALGFLKLPSMAIFPADRPFHK